MGYKRTDYCPDAALWDHGPSKDVFARLRQNSVVVPGKETRQFAQLARDHQLTIVIGVNERVESGPGKGLVWGQDDGGGLAAVATPQGRVGGLICWEHWMPLARQALHDSGEHLRIAVWPTVREMHQLASRHYAFEGRCFVLVCGLIMRAGDLPNELRTTAELAGSRRPSCSAAGARSLGRMENTLSSRSSKQKRS